MDIKEVRLEGVDWIHLARDRTVVYEPNNDVSGSINYRGILD
jgi:hypothetical protein